MKSPSAIFLPHKNLAEELAKYSETHNWKYLDCFNCPRLAAEPQAAQLEIMEQSRNYQWRNPTTGTTCVIGSSFCLQHGLNLPTWGGVY